VSRSLEVERPPAIEIPESPYIGLEPYSEKDAPFFFGRERERRVIAANLRASRVTLLYGPSGVGKSSVLNAGVVCDLGRLGTELRTEEGRPQHVVVAFSSWRDDPEAPLAEAIREAVSGALGEVSQAPAGNSLLETLERSAELYEGELLVILDQFEEFFVYHPRADPDSPLPVALARAIRDPDLRVNFLISLREDALAGLHLFKGLIPGLFENRLRLDRLSHEAGRDAIVRPLEHYNELVPEEDAVELEPELVEEVLDEVTAGRVHAAHVGIGAVAHESAETGIEAPFLQLVMERLWHERGADGSRALRLATLRELGGAQHIVRTHLYGALAGLEPAQREAAAAMFNHLVTPSGTKIAHRAADLARWAGADEASVESTLRALAQARILRPVAAEDRDDSRYEIYHDVLAGAVLEWRTQYEANERVKREWRRRLRLGAAVLGALALAVVVGLAVFAFIQRGEAQEESRAAARQALIAAEQRGAAERQGAIARSRELAANAAVQLNIDPHRSLLLGIAAADVVTQIESPTSDETRQAEGALRRALSESRLDAVLRGHTARVVEAAFAPDGRTVVTASADGSARIWDADSGEQLHVLREHERAVESTAFSPDGNQVVTASWDETARIWDAGSGEELHVLRGHSGRVVGAVFSPDGRWVVTASADRTARIWDAGSGEELHVLRGHARLVTAAAFSPDGERVVTASVDGTARIWDAGSGAQLQLLRGHGDPVRSAAFSYDGRRVVTAGGDRTARIWDAASGNQLVLLRGHEGVVVSAAFSPDGRKVVTASTDGSARLWDARSGDELVRLRAHEGSVESAIFSPNGGEVVTASADGSARIWETESGDEIANLRGHEDSVVSAAFSADGGRVVTASEDGTARIWDAESEQLLVLEGHDRLVAGAAFSADGRRIVTASWDGTARIWDAESGAELTELPGHGDAVLSAAFSPDGRRVVTASDDGTARIWNAESGQELLVLGGHERAVRTASFSPDGRRVVTASDDGTARIWDAGSGSELALLPHQTLVVSADFSPDGQRVVTASEDRTAQIWNAETGERLLTLRRHEGAVGSAAFSPDGTRVVTASADRTARIWDAQTGEERGVLRGHSDLVRRAAFSPDGRQVATASADGTARIWDAQTGEELAVLRGHQGAVESATFSPTGDRVVTASGDGTARVFACEICGSLEQLLARARQRVVEEVPLTELEQGL
jgi:WD40 repeat protein